MRRVVHPDRPGGWLFNGKRYPSEAQYRVALTARDVRRRRLLAWMEADDRGETWESFNARWRD